MKFNLLIVQDLCQVYYQAEALCKNDRKDCISDLEHTRVQLFRLRQKLKKKV